MSGLPPARFGRVMTAMVTPFDADLRLDIDAAVGLARWLVDEGCEGFVLSGTTGEASVLDDEEKLSLFEAVATAVSVPCIAGTGSNDTPHSIELTERATDLGCLAGILAVTPYYNRPSQAGIAAHFRAMAEATDLPVMVYDIPVRTGRAVEHDTMLRLLEQVPNIVAVKDATGTPAASARLMAHAPSAFELYSGDDGLTLPLLAVGAVGVVSVATHWSTPEHVQMVRAFDRGDIAEARRINALLQESFTYESSLDAPNPIPAKAMMRVIGHDVGQCRLPMGPAPEGLEEQAREVLKNLQNVRVQ